MGSLTVSGAVRSPVGVTSISSTFFALLPLDQVGRPVMQSTYGRRSPVRTRSRLPVCARLATRGGPGGCFLTSSVASGRNGGQHPAGARWRLAGDGPNPRSSANLW